MALAEGAVLCLLLSWDPGMWAFFLFNWFLFCFLKSKGLPHHCSSTWQCIPSDTVVVKLNRNFAREILVSQQKSHTATGRRSSRLTQRVWLWTALWSLQPIRGRVCKWSCIISAGPTSATAPSLARKGKWGVSAPSTPQPVFDCGPKSSKFLANETTYQLQYDKIIMLSHIIVIYSPFLTSNQHGNGRLLDWFWQNSLLFYWSCILCCLRRNAGASHLYKHCSCTYNVLVSFVVTMQMSLNMYWYRTIDWNSLEKWPRKKKNFSDNEVSFTPHKHTLVCRLYLQCGITAYSPRISSTPLVILSQGR